MCWFITFQSVLLWWYHNDKKSLPDIGGTTIQDVGCLAAMGLAMEPGVHTWATRYFSIVRNLSREPDFWAKNRIFKNFSKSLKTCLVGVFWVFQSTFSIARHLSREPDFWDENQIFKNFFKSLKTCYVGVFWVFHGFLKHCSTSAPRTGFF